MSRLPHLQRYSRWLAIITPVVSFCFGIIGGKLLEARINPLFDTNTKSTLTGLFFIGLISVILLIVVTIFANRSEERETLWLQSIGTPAELIFERVDTAEGTYFKQLRAFVAQASLGDEILIMSQHRPNKNVVDDIRYAKRPGQARDRYSRALIQKAKEAGIIYRRIVCFEDCSESPEINAKYVKPWLVEHCREMLKIKSEKPDKVSLKISTTKIGADIFVITGKVGTIVLDIYDSQTGKATTFTSLIFHNPPNSRIINQLHDWFMEIDGESTTIPISNVT